MKALCPAFLILLPAVAACAVSMSIDSLTGPVTSNEIDSFKAYMAAQIPPPTPWGALNGTNGDHNEWADGYGGNDLEAMGLMYESSGDSSILTNLVAWTDACVSQRNDLMPAAQGGQRVMWTGKIDKVWCPNEPTSANATYAGGENGDTKAHVLYTALLILQRPYLWKQVVPDGDPYGYGATYYDRAAHYVAICDQANAEYDDIFITTTNTIRDPANWPSGFHTMNAINIQMMMLGDFERDAQCHEIMGDDPSLVSYYDTVVKTATTECLDGMASCHPGAVNGETVYAWGYYPWSVYPSEIESVGHGAYDMVGIYRAFSRVNYGFKLSAVQPLANAEVDVMNVASNTFSDYVDGSGGTQNYMQAQWLMLADWNPAVYDVTAPAELTSGRYKTTTLMDATILWMKDRRYQEFSVTPTVASATVSPGAGTNLTVTVAPLGGFTNTVNLAFAGLPAGATGGFSSSAINLGALNYVSTNVAFSIGTSISTPAGTYPVSVIGTSGSVSHTNTFTLVIGNASPVWTGGSASSGDWSDPANWGGATIAPGDSLTFAGTTRLFNVNDTAANTGYSNITFNADAGAFLLTGNPITLNGSYVVNDSTAGQAIYLGLNFNSDQTFDGGAGSLTIAGGLTNTVSGSAITTLMLSGSGQLSDAWMNSNNPGGTNEIVLNDASADWTITHSIASPGTPVPWVFEIDQGTLNFGTTSGAPVVTLTAPDNSPSDNQVGNVSGATGTFNMVNGTLTTASRFNTGTAANATGVLNQVGGTFNIGVQFQGANAGHVNTGVSIVNLSGGVMNINPSAETNGTFYVASRGIGTLNVSGNAVLNCGTLDVSRGVSSEPSQGAVNLNGGTVAAANVTDSSTTPISTATFNFNGGTLKARSGSTTFFTQSATIPLTVNVQSGGAVFDTAGFNDTVLISFLHDSSLNATPDGGLTKLGAGTLTLTAINTYTGSTTISDGVLALDGSGSVANSPLLVIAGGATLDVSGLSSGLNLISSQTLSNSTSTAGLSGNVATGPGTVSLMYASGTPSLTVANGVLTLSSGTTFRVNNTGPALAAGSYTIISAGAGGSVAVTDKLPPVTLSGNGLAAETTASLQMSSSGLELIVAPLPQPRFTGITLNGTTLTIRATNGVAGGQYVLLQSTNAALPLAQWTPVLTNGFDGNGSLNLSTNIINPDVPHEFYILSE